MSSRTLQDKIKNFKQFIKEIKYHEEIINMMYWDLRTGAPRGGLKKKSEIMGAVAKKRLKMIVSNEMNTYLEYFSEFEDLDYITKALLRECKILYKRNINIPLDKYESYIALISKAETIREEAKKKSDFSIVQPYLERIVSYNLEFIELWGYKENKYNALLGFYEPGMTVKKLDPIFNLLKNKLPSIVTDIKRNMNQPDESFLYERYDKHKQLKFSQFILKEIGYNFERGRLDESVHPLTLSINSNDIRLTTRFEHNNIKNSIFATLHEGGHGLYEQNISQKLSSTLLFEGSSMGIHESQSRLWENIIGRNLSFWECYYGKLQCLFPEILSSVPVQSFYRAINKVAPSLIRVNADELTYNLHIMIRYEIEKMLFNKDITVSDLPCIWNDMYKEMLGVTPKNEAEGILQDGQWSGGRFGYFPSYSLGNLYAAQIYNVMKKELGDFDNLIKLGELHVIKQWLSEKIYDSGKIYTPEEIILKISGEELNPQFFINYLIEKYNNVYSLNIKV